MLDETGMLGIHKKEEPQPVVAPAASAPKLFSPDKMTPAEMIGTGAVMLGNIAFISWWAMNEDTSEVIEMIDTPTVPTTESAPNLIVPSILPSVPPEPHSSVAILEVAEVKQEDTFKEAFDAARNQVGPGGVFEWRGQWYNTYTAEEWTDMAPEGKQDYATLVKPFLDHDEDIHSSMPQHDVLSGQDPHIHVEVADTEAQPPEHLLHSPMETHLDTLDDLFLNT